MVRTAAYGTWQSPISVDDVAAEGGRPDWLAVHDGAVWWTQSLPAEGGRLTLVVAEGADEPRELLPAPWNVRNRVQEYGGRPWVLLPRSDGQLVAFTNWADQRMYVFDPAAAEPAPVPITPTPEKKHGWRYADLVAGAGGDEVWCVRETVTGDKPTDIRRELVAIPVSGAAVNNADEIRIIANSHHFLTAPKPSPNGRHIAWLGWNHPAMPWDGTQLCIAESGGKSTVGNGKNTAEYGGKNTVENYRVVAGGPRESVCQFEWEDDDNILALTDPEGWWNLHRIQLNSDS
ncbi:MAG: S9 family peptidase, partial [Sciscionella sp.]|nr:S9 family peptidase [Sciscionella sp.]